MLFNIPDQHRHSSGIYAIRNIINDRRYVGSASSFYKRFHGHCTRLNNERHHSVKMQRAFEKHGETNFVFEILEVCQTEKLVSREQYWIDYFNSTLTGYNICPASGSPLGIKRTDAFRIRMSQLKRGVVYNEKTRKKQSLAHIGIKKTEQAIAKMVEKCTRHYQMIDADGNIIKTYFGLKEAKADGHSTSGVSTATTTGKLYKGVYWKRFPKWDRVVDKSNSGKPRKKIYQYDLTGNLIQRFESITVASLATDIRKSNIICAAKGKTRKTAGGFIWSYDSELKEVYVPQRKKRIITYGKRVACFNKAAEKIAEYDSITNASKATNTSIQNILSCLRGKSKTAAGLVWKRI